MDRIRHADKLRVQTSSSRAVVCAAGLLAIALSACYTATPVAATPTAETLRGVEQLRITYNDGRRRDVWHPVMHGDTAMVALADNFGRPSTPSVHILLKDVRTIERVQYHAGRSVVYAVALTAGAIATFGLLLLLTGRFPVD